MKFILFISLILLISCGERSGLKFSESLINNTLPTGSFVDFTTLKSKVLEPHCMSCHRRATTEEGISQWVDTNDYENSALLQVVMDGSMPKNAAPLSSAEVEIVRSYLFGLNEENEIPKVTFEQIKGEILVPHCLNCHRKMDNEESLVKWIDINNPENSRFYVTVKEGSMPKRASPLSSSEQTLILNYLKGYKR